VHHRAHHHKPAHKTAPVTSKPKPVAAAPVEVSASKDSIHRVAAIVPVKSDAGASPTLLALAALVLLLLALASASVLRLALQSGQGAVRRSF
jgi:hypothetical protein